MLEVVAFRWADYDRPFRAHIHTNGGRYQRAGSAPTQYWALHPLGPWAEFLRWNFIGPPPHLDGVRQRVWAARFTFDNGELLELTYDWARTSSRIAPDDLVSDNHTGCQAFAEWARSHYTAMVVPSAALPGTQNLVVFGTRTASPYQLPPVDRTIDVPASVVAEKARPPSDLAAYVRFLGQPHAEFTEWLAGRPYVAPAPLGVPSATPTF
jgi:hypothetical protein